MHSCLNAHPYLNILILKKHTRYNIWTEKYVDLYLYDQLQFDLLEKKSICPQILAVYFLIYEEIKAKIKSYFQIHVGNCSKFLIQIFVGYL